MFRSLTQELKTTGSPVRRFLQERYGAGVPQVQRAIRATRPRDIVVPPAPAAAVNPGTVGTAADWLLRFLIHPQPDLSVARGGAVIAGNGGLILCPALIDLARRLDVPFVGANGDHAAVFAGPIPGSVVDAEVLARACWALALLTEVYRAGPTVARSGPLAQLRGQLPTAADLLFLAPPAGIEQLIAFRHLFDTVLLPRLSDRVGEWALGPVFTGSQLLAADADLIAAGLLLELKTSAESTITMRTLLQLVGYVLLDFDDRFRLTEVGVFGARYGHFATWELGSLLNTLAGRRVDLQTARAEFRDFLCGVLGYKEVPAAVGAGNAAGQGSGLQLGRVSGVGSNDSVSILAASYVLGTDFMYCGLDFEWWKPTRTKDLAQEIFDWLTYELRTCGDGLDVVLRHILERWTSIYPRIVHPEDTSRSAVQSGQVVVALYPWTGTRWRFELVLPMA